MKYKNIEQILIDEEANTKAKAIRVLSGLFPDCEVQAWRRPYSVIVTYKGLAMFKVFMIHDNPIIHSAKNAFRFEKPSRRRYSRAIDDSDADYKRCMRALAKAA